MNATVDKKQIDPSPEHFYSYEEAAEFWDTHDLTDYADEFRTVEFTSGLRGRHFEVEIDEDVLRALQQKAQRFNRYLASNLLRQQLKIAA